MFSAQVLFAIALLATSAYAFAFNGVPITAGGARPGPSVRRQEGGRSGDTTALFAAEELLSLRLEKPLGMILEEIEEGQPRGVKVEELADSGSARASEYGEALVGLKVARVMGEDVTELSFDDVMAKIVDAPSPVDIDFEVVEGSAEDEDEEASGDEPECFELGTPVTITVIQDGVETPVQAKVGDNLRRTLLENKIELYRGLKKKLGNCGGVGQCTYCAVDFVEGRGWGERSEYEEGKIGKYPTARLACMNNIMGPATIRLQ